MKNRILLFVLVLNLYTCNLFAQKDDPYTFGNYHELGKFAFSYTDLKSTTNGFLFDYAFGFYDDKTLDKILPKTNQTNADLLLETLSLIEKSDVNEKFNKDSLLFPFMYGFYAANGYSPLTIPLVITDIDISTLVPNARRQINEWKSENPFPQFKNNDFKLENVYNAAVFCDTFVYNNIQLYWTSETYVSNTNRSIEHVYVIANNQTIELPKSIPVSINDLYDINRPLQKIIIKIEFSDGTIKTTEQNIFLKKNKDYNDFPQNKSSSDGGFIYGNILSEYDNFTVTHSLEWKTYYGCNDDSQILDKPYFLIMGWGPFTDEGAINSAQNWPTPMDGFYGTINIAGLIEELNAASYDVIIVRHFPPNASVVDNADLLIKLINQVNEIKNSNGSYEENIIHGKSAGSLATKLALLKMEYEHLNNNGPHHQTKLYVSHDGEHQGANIPLGWQGCIKYLNDNHTSLKIYTLNFILNATQTKELVKYHYTNVETPTPERQTYLDAHLPYNHFKNQHILNYPAFCRNISSSNGSPISDINGNFSNQPPFHDNEANTFYSAQTSIVKFKKEVRALASQRYSNIPFQFRKKIPFSSWNIQYQIVTGGTMLNVDNANGGGMFEVVNANHAILEIMKNKFSQEYIGVIENKQYCFTPILFTHDVRNYDYAAHNYLLDYNFYNERLLFQTENQALNYIGGIDEDNSLSETNFYGYPHLGHPQNHYNYTPFDALFVSAEVNTEHLTFNYVDGDGGNGSGANPTDRARFKNWLISEADCYNSFLQNKKYGFNARSNYVYKAHINSPHTIFIGSHVTQRTDFKGVEVQQNAVLICNAADQIIIKPGFKTEYGAVFAARINPYNCSTTKQVIATEPYIENTSDNNAIVSNTKEENEIVIFPNPTTNNFTIKTTSNLLITYQIFNLQGEMVKTGNELFVTTNFPKGMYVVSITQNDKISTHKLIIK